MTIEFKDFPVSYRISQGGITLVLALTFSTAAFSQNAPPLVKIIVGSLFGLIVVVSLAISVYVVIRYPFLSLVPSSDGDHFTRHFSLSGTWLYQCLKLLAAAATVILIISLLTGGIDSVTKILVLIYLMIMLFFLIFLAFVYEPIRHPTIATLIRATLGIGVLLFPLFLPAVIIGSRRCNELLDGVSDPSIANRQN